MKCLSRAILVAGGLMAAPGVTAAQDDGLLRLNVRAVERVEFASDITPEAALRYETIILPGQIVEIQSDGGDLGAALAMAEANARLRARLLVLGGLGRCQAECALVWLAAPERLGPDFVPVFFDGGALPWTEAVAFRPQIATFEESEAIRFAAQGWDRALEARGIAPWLQACAWRLRNVRFDAFPEGWQTAGRPVRDRVRVTADFDAVWFPREVLEAAGVTGLAIFDPPNEMQRIRHAPHGPEGAGRILWADVDACDVERDH